MLLHAQDREITDDLDLVQVARNFVDANDERKEYFGPADYCLATVMPRSLTERIPQFTIIHYLLASTSYNLSSKRGTILMFITLS